MSDRKPIGCVVVVFIIVFATILCFDYRAYRLRFPDAPGWTYLFK